MSRTFDQMDALEADEASAAASRPTIEGLFRQHGRDVYRIVRRLLGPQASAADVDDLSQQVFLAAHKDLPRFRGDAAPRTWLYGIATRVVLMHFRSWRRRLAALAAFADATRVTEAPPPTPDATFAERQELARVARGLEALKPEKRVVFVLHEVEGLSGKEIAAILSIPEATVFTRLYYARRELLAALARESERREHRGAPGRREVQE